MKSNIKIEFLGVGNSFSRKYGNNSALVTVENKNGTIKRLLIDCGRTTPNDLTDSGYTWEDIDAIFITHLHGDHVYGLEDAGFMSRYVYNSKPHIIFPDSKMKNDLWSKVLKGTMAMGDLERMMKFEDYFTWETVEKEEEHFMFNGVMFSVYPTIHIKNKKSYGLIIGERNYILYTSDSLLNKDLIEIAVADGCQAIFHDCSFSHYDGMVHASLKQLLELNDDIRDRIYIMHYSDDLAYYYNEIKEGNLKIAVKNTEYKFEVINSLTFSTE